MDKNSEIVVAKIIKTQGNRGEVAAVLLTDFPDRFQHVSSLILGKEGVADTALELTSHWFHKGRIVFKFCGVDNISAAERLVGFDVKVHYSDLMPLTSGTYYQHDLVGCTLQSLDGSPQGRVVEVLGTAGQYLLKVQRDSTEFLVPFAESYFPSINIESKLLICDLPKGLDELS